jgi:hypothetical protein
MSWMKRVIISLAIVVIAGIGGFTLYYMAYARGDTAGYGRGYSTGQEIGYSSGRQDGYSDGYVSGKADGYDEGYDLGEADGYNEGYDEGLEAGLGHGYALRDPTYEQATSFLRRDKTDKNEYVEDTYGVYVCSHFARDVCNNAEAEGLRCAFVGLRYLEGGHSIVAFDTIDKGLVYFDAMTDERANPVVGERYYRCIEPRPGYYYAEPDFDDTIMDILVIW